MSSSLPEGAAHAPLKIEARGSKPALRGFVPIQLLSTFPFWGMPWSWGGHSRPAARSRRRAAPLSQAVFDGSLFVFVFSLGGPTPSEAAGGRPLTQRSKTLGPGACVLSTGTASAVCGLAPRGAPGRAIGGQLSRQATKRILAARKKNYTLEVYDYTCCMLTAHNMNILYSRAAERRLSKYAPSRTTAHVRMRHGEGGLTECQTLL